MTPPLVSTDHAAGAAEKRPPAPERADVRIAVACPFPFDVLAVGGELKNTICVGQGALAVLSGWQGDLSQIDCYRHFVDSVSRAADRLGRRPVVIGHDLHPAYLSTVHARRLAPPKVAVQHHHAHAVSCAVDAEMTLPVIGIVCDGTGYGTDGAIWGGEVLLCNARSFRRLAHLEYFPLPGGDAAARWAWRPAMSVVRLALPDSYTTIEPPAFRAVNAKERALIDRQLDAGLNSPSTSSLGRLFDAVAFLTGVCAQNEQESQAARALQAASTDERVKPYPFALIDDSEGVRLDWRPMIRSIVADVQADVCVGWIAARFHETVAAMFAAAALRAVRETGVERVVLSGGCFVNERLREGVRSRLEDRGLQVGVHRRVSAGDAGLSLGQAVVASATAAGQE